MDGWICIYFIRNWKDKKNPAPLFPCTLLHDDNALGRFRCTLWIGTCFFPWDKWIEASDSSTKHGYLLWQCHVSLIKKIPEKPVFLSRLLRAHTFLFKLVDIFYRSGMGIFNKEPNNSVQCQWFSYFFKEIQHSKWINWPNMCTFECLRLIAVKDLYCKYLVVFSYT